MGSLTDKYLSGGGGSSAGGLTSKYLGRSSKITETDTFKKRLEEVRRESEAIEAQRRVRSAVYGAQTALGNATDRINNWITGDRKEDISSDIEAYERALEALKRYGKDTKAASEWIAGVRADNNVTVRENLYEDVQEAKDSRKGTAGQYLLRSLASAVAGMQGDTEGMRTAQQEATAIATQRKTSKQQQKEAEAALASHREQYGNVLTAGERLEQAYKDEDEAIRKLSIIRNSNRPGSKLTEKQAEAEKQLQEAQATISELGGTVDARAARGAAKSYVGSAGAGLAYGLKGEDTRKQDSNIAAGEAALSEALESAVMRGDRQEEQRLRTMVDAINRPGADKATILAEFLPGIAAVTDEVALRDRRADLQRQELGDKGYAAFKELYESGNAELEASKVGKSEAEKVLIDVAVQGGNMAADAVLGIPGTLLGMPGAMAPMALRTYGAGVIAAESSGASQKDAMLYGMASAGVEMLSEKLFDGLAGVYGGGKADELVDYFIGKMAKTKSGRAAWNLLFSAGGESVEELISGIADPVLTSIYNDRGVFENLSETEAADVLYDMLIGGIMGFLGGSIEGLTKRQDDASKFFQTAAEKGLTYKQALQIWAETSEVNVERDVAEIMGKAESAALKAENEAKRKEAAEKAEQAEYEYYEKLTHRAQANKVLDSAEKLDEFQQRTGIDLSKKTKGEQARSIMEESVKRVAEIDQRREAEKARQAVEDMDTGAVTLNEKGETVVDGKVVDMSVKDTLVKVGFSEARAEDLAKQYDPNTATKGEYAKAMHSAYAMARAAVPEGEIETYVRYATDAQKRMAAAYGEADRANAAKAAQEAVKAKVGDTVVRGEGGIINDTGRSIDLDTLDAPRKAGYQMAQALSKAVGNNVHLFESVERDGKRVLAHDVGPYKAGDDAPNGWYDHSTGDIYVDINAGERGQGTILYTLSHEYTHFIRQWSPEKFETLAKFLFENADISIEAAIQNQMDKANRAGRDIDRDKAMEEVVADAMESMLSDTNAAEKIIELRNRDKGLWEKLKELITKIRNAVRAAYKDFAPDSHEGLMLKRMDESLTEKLSTLFAEGVADAAENYSRVSDLSEKKTNSLSIRGNWKKWSEKEPTYAKNNRNGVFVTNEFVDFAAESNYSRHRMEKVFDMNEREYQTFSRTLSDLTTGMTDGEERAIIIFTASSNDIKDTFAYFFDADGYRKGSVMARVRIGSDSALLDNIIRELSGNESGRNSRVFDRRTWNNWYERLRGVYRYRSSGGRGETRELTGLDGDAQRTSDERGNSFESGEDFENPVEGSVVYDPNAVHVDDISNSLRDMDSNGRKLTPEQQDYFKDSKVRDENGSLKIMYRGDNDNFTVFDRKKSKYSNLYGRGFYFTESESHAKQYGNAKSFYLDIKNPVSTTDQMITKEQMRKFLSAVADNEDDYSFENYGYGATVDSVLNSVYSGKSDFAMLYDVSQTAIGDMVAAVELFNEVNGTNYDGLILDTETVTFRSEQAKNVDNVKPTNNPDIRYSLRNQPTTDRYVLTNAEGQNDTETRILARYREEYGVLVGLEESLVSQREALKAVQSTKDRDAIRMQREEIMATENRINIQQGILSRMEDSATLQRVLKRERENEILEGYERGRFDQGYETAPQIRREMDAKATEEYLKGYERGRFDQGIKMVEEQRKAMEYAEKQMGQKVNRLEQRLAAAETEEKRRVQQLKDYRQNASRKELLRKIGKTTKELNEWLAKPTKDKHIPSKLIGVVVEALDAVNMDTVNADERLAIIDRRLAEIEKSLSVTSEYANRKRLEDERAKLVRQQGIISKQGYRLRENLSKLQSVYNEIRNSDDPVLAGAYDENISAKIQEVWEYVGDTSLRDMRVDQLQMVYDLYRMVSKSVRNGNKAFRAAKNATIEELATSVMEDMASKKERGEVRNIRNTIEKLVWTDMKPAYAFKTIGSKTMTNLFNAVRSGEDTWAKDVSEARAFYLGEAEKHGVNGWNMDEKFYFTSTSGLDFELTLGDIMSIYAYSKREQALDHLAKGGIVLEPPTDKKGPFAKVSEKATAYNLSPEILAEITGKLTSGQKAFVDAMQRYLSTDMGNKGNEVSEALYDVKLFTEENYFPLRSSSAYMARVKDQQKGEVRIKNSGFTKATTPNASNPIVMQPFMEVWSEHVSDMAMYHAFTLPLEDFYRVYNFKTAADETSEIESVNKRIQNVYGKAAIDYIDTLLRDINGGARGDKSFTAAARAFSKFKKASVMASASVVVQQPSAIARAFNYIPVTYFIGPKVNAETHDRVWDEMKKYAPIAVIKEIGSFDQNAGKRTVDWIGQKQYGTFMEKVGAFFTDNGFRDDAFGYLAGKADEITWCAIWEASKRMAQDTTKLQGEALLQKAGEIFTETVVNTQVYDSVMSRSQLMRSKDGMAQMLTAFMGEPTTTLNMLYDAVLQGKRGDYGYAAKTIGSVTASIALNAALVSFVKAARDDDEDESYWEKYMAAMFSAFRDGINVRQMIPYVRDLVSLGKGFDVERTDVSVYSDVMTAWNKLMNAREEDEATAKEYIDLLANFGNLLGIPATNLIRDGRAVRNVIAGMDEKSTAAGIRDAIREGWTGERKSDGQQLYEALMAGDTKQIERVTGRYETQKEADADVRKYLREADSRIAEAALARFEGRTAEYDRIINEIINEGKLDRNVVVGAVRAEEERLDEDTVSTETKISSLYTLDDLIKSYANGEYDLTERIRDDIVTTAQQNGKTSMEAEGQFKSNASSAAKKAYMDGSINSTTAKKILQNYAGKGMEDATDTLKAWEFEKLNGWIYNDRGTEYRYGNITRKQLISAMMSYGGKTREEAELSATVYDWKNDGYDRATNAMVEGYVEGNLSAAGISKDVWYEAYTTYNDTKGVDADGDGKTDSYSKTKAVMPLIDALPISNEQKTQIALQFWSKSTVSKYKTW